MDEIIEEPIAAPAPEPEDGGMYLTGMAVYDLNRAAKWAKFLAIVGFIVTALIAVVALFVGTIFSTIGAAGGTAFPAAMGSVVTVIYLIIAAVTGTICLFLYQFADRTMVAIETRDQERLEKGIHRLQSYFKAYGIITIVYLSIVVLCLVFGGLITTLLRH